MKNILVTIILTSVSVCVFAQKTNNRGEYMVKSIHWVNAFTQKEVGGVIKRESGVNPEQSRCCLLYTSPSPRDVEESRMPSSA